MGRSQQYDCSGLVCLLCHILDAPCAGHLLCVYNDDDDASRRHQGTPVQPAICHSQVLHGHNTLALVCRESCLQLAKLVQQCLAEVKSMATGQHAMQDACVTRQDDSQVRASVFPITRNKQSRMSS